MSFLHPNFLYFVLPPLFILFGFLLTQKEADLHFFSDEVISKLRVSANTLTQQARNAIYLLMGILMVIAMANPVIKDGTIEIKAKSADIMIALDISDSMLAKDVYPNRLELAKQKALSLLEDAPNERIGVVAFAKKSYLVSPLSFDHEAVRFLLSKLNTTSITQKGTDFLGILDVIAKVKNKNSKKYLLILSDGGDSKDFSNEIAYAKENNIVVFVLGIGTQKGAPIKQADGSFIKYKGDIIITKLNDSISELATKSGGVYIQNTTSDSDIKAMLKEIESMSEEKELKSQEIPKYTPLFYYPLGLAIVLLLIATSSVGRGLKTTLPALALITLFMGVDSKADVLDFMELEKAKKAYQSGDFKSSAQEYESYAKNQNNPQSFYNAGNSYYKDGDYGNALKSYKRAIFRDNEQKAKNYANIGNTYVKQGKKGGLEKAIEAYEKSLKIKEDKDTRENLEAVKKFLEKKKEQSKNKNDKKKSDKDKKLDKKDGDSNSNKDSKSDKDKNSKNKKSDSDKNKNSDKQKERSEKNKDSKANDSKTDKQKNQAEKKENQNNGDDSKKDKKQDESKQPKEKKDKEKNSNATTKQQQGSPVKMSDSEAKKWLQRLNGEKHTYMYRLDTKRDIEENRDEKPW